MNNFISVRDINRKFEAHNLAEPMLEHVVRSWFLDVPDADIRRALGDLSEATKRQQALQFLGIEIL